VVAGEHHWEEERKDTITCGGRVHACRSGDSTGWSSQITSIVGLFHAIIFLEDSMHPVLGKLAPSGKYPNRSVLSS